MAATITMTVTAVFALASEDDASAAAGVFCISGAKIVHSTKPIAFIRVEEEWFNFHKRIESEGQTMTEKVHENFKMMRDASQCDENGHHISFSNRAFAYELIAT